MANLITSCPEGWSLFRGACYLKQSELKNWYDAQDSCEAQGGNLVSCMDKMTADYVSFLERSLSDPWVGVQDM